MPPRLSTQDHVLFDESIESLRPQEPITDPLEIGPSTSFLLTDFLISEPWEFRDFRINPSIRKELPCGNAAYISEINNPHWVGISNANLFGIGIAAVITFVTGRACKSTRDSHLCNRPVSPDAAIELAMMHPIRYAGSGAISPLISSTKLAEHRSSVARLFEKLHSIPHSEYVIIMQSIRLCHLSLLSKRDDYGLAYFLAVAAIEAIAQTAIPNAEFDKSKEKEWKEHFKNDEIGKELLAAYRALRNEAQKTGKTKSRFIKFISTYAPPSTWRSITQSNMFTETPVAPSEDLRTEETLTEAALLDLISQTYNLRSRFAHAGAQPPNSSPNSPGIPLETKREYQFIEVEHRIGDEAFTHEVPVLSETVLPTHELLIGIARHAISEWVYSLTNETA